MSKPGVAALLSFVLPGAGQLYNGAIWRGLFWFVICGLSWIWTVGLGGWVVHLIASYTAWSYADRLEQRRFRVTV